jgi:hypothetical protein
MNNVYVNSLFNLNDKIDFAYGMLHICAVSMSILVLWFQEVITSIRLLSVKHKQQKVAAPMVLNDQNGKGMDKLQITTPRK